MSLRLLFLRRGVTFAALAVWLGGLTFYALVAVPVGTAVLGGAVAQGFITQAVTERLNLVGAAALALLAWNVFACPRDRRRFLLVTWATMLVAQAVLFALHPSLDQMLEPASRAVKDHTTFYALHRVYLLVTAAQWIAGVVHTMLVLLAWRAEDRR